MSTDKNTNISKTAEQFARQTDKCRSLFSKKTHDYGTSWRIMRLSSLTDQIFIKANRIRSVQESGENRVGDDLQDEFIAMVNYAVMALIQKELTECGDTRLELTLAETLSLYDKYVEKITSLMFNKNHDYGEAWRQMRVSSMVDLILMKLMRIKQIEDNQGVTLSSEGVEGGYIDIVNYSLFCLIRLEEQNEASKKV